MVAAARWIANDNPHSARVFRDAIAEAAVRIGDHPHIGSTRRHLLPSAFRFLPLPAFRYLIIYNAERTPPEIVAIVHSARDLPRVLRDLG